MSDFGTIVMIALAGYSRPPAVCVAFLPVAICIAD
jgi:hypothetical protein